MFTCFIDEALRLLLHPLLIVVFHIFFVFSAAAVRLPHRRLQQKQKGTTGYFTGTEDVANILNTLLENLPSHGLGRCRSSRNRTCQRGRKEGN